MKIVITFAVAAACIAAPLGTALAQQPQTETHPMPPQHTPAPPPQSPSGAGQSGLTIASDSLVGTKVHDAQGKELGVVSKLMIDAKHGNVTTVIIRHGATLGMGGREIAVPWNALQLQRGQDQELVVTMQQQMLEPTPGAQEQKQEERTPAASPPATAPQQPRQR